MYISDSEIELIINEVVKRFLIPKFYELNMNATGEWVESLEVVASEGVGTIRGRNYSEWLAKGRKPNKEQDTNEMRKWAFGMANYNPEFMAWLTAKGLTNYGVQIAYQIAKKGTTHYQKGGTDLIEILSSREVVDFINNAIQSKLTIKINEVLTRQLKEIL